MKKIFAGNWKMNGSPESVEKYFLKFLADSHFLSFNADKIDLHFYLPNLLIHYAQSIMLSGSRPEIRIGAQNCHWEPSGAYTGETSGQLLKDLGIDHVLIGHSERRVLFGETNETAIKRVLFALRTGLEVIYCIGETLAEREQGQTNAVIETQLKPLCFLNETSQKPLLEKLRIAYEPVWAIGTGRVATQEQVESAHALIRNFFPKTPILYGGSVTAENAPILAHSKNVDGFLVGGASLNPNQSLQILKHLYYV